MNNIINNVSYKTKSILWIPKDGMNPNSSIYKAVNYLTNGLLVSKQNDCAETSSNVLVADHFNDKLFIFIIHKPVNNEIDSFFKIIKNGFATESEILIFDEQNIFDEIKKRIPKELVSYCKIIQI